MPGRWLRVGGTLVHWLVNHISEAHMVCTGLKKKLPFPHRSQIPGCLAGSPEVVWQEEAGKAWEWQVRKTGCHYTFQKEILQLFHTYTPSLAWTENSKLSTAMLCSYPVLSCSVVSNSLWPCGLQLARLPCPWDSLGRILEWVATPMASRNLPRRRSWSSGSDSEPWSPPCLLFGCGPLRHFHHLYPSAPHFLPIWEDRRRAWGC